MKQLTRFKNTAISYDFILIWALQNSYNIMQNEVLMKSEYLKKQLL